MGWGRSVRHTGCACDVMRCMYLVCACWLQVAVAAAETNACTVGSSTCRAATAAEADNHASWLSHQLRSHQLTHQLVKKGTCSNAFAIRGCSSVVASSCCGGSR